ncbi:MAG: Fe-S-containing hydro-lyase [Candidatus Zixiibacteriota bacterium]|nr:MAG: Fe-S-containing hydro-lyase [candidate division Zixibacteria bacterium]
MSADVKRLTTPLTNEVVESLHAGDKVLITGVIYSARDAAHKRLCDLVAKGEPLPIEIQGQTIYFMGPSPAKPGQPIGSAGPTTSYRMDAYSPTLIALGLKGMIGKGVRGKDVLDAMIQHKAVYFAATGGAAALIARSIKKAEVVAYEDLGAEAIRRLEVVDFPAIVAQDCHGQNYYEIGVAQYRRA